MARNRKKRATFADLGFPGLRKATPVATPLETGLDAGPLARTSALCVSKRSTLLAGCSDFVTGKPVAAVVDKLYGS